MAIYVQKFGGTSVGSVERILQVAKIIQSTLAAGHQVVAVVSAMQGETDRLIQLCQEINSEVYDREYAAVVSTGEQVSAALLALALNKIGCPAKSYTGWQAQIHTTQQYQKARITNINTDLLRVDLEEGITPVITGFQGIDEQNTITTLGRGGSDLTAVALAAALPVDECQIFTDVEGVFTSDPRLVNNARLLDHISFDEMLALADLGAKVLHNRSVEFAQKYSIPLRVLSSFNVGEGTLITHPASDLVLPVVSGIAADRHQAKLSLVGLPPIEAKLQQFFTKLRDASIDVDMIVQHAVESDQTLNVSFTVPRDDYAQALRLADQFAKSLGASCVHGQETVAKLSLVGLGMRSHAGVAAKFFHVLGEAGIDIQLISSTEVKISALIDVGHLQQGVQLLHDAFQLAEVLV